MYFPFTPSVCLSALEGVRGEAPLKVRKEGALIPSPRLTKHCYRRAEDANRSGEKDRRGPGPRLCEKPELPPRDPLSLRPRSQPNVEAIFRLLQELLAGGEMLMFKSRKKRKGQGPQGRQKQLPCRPSTGHRGPGGAVPGTAAAVTARWATAVCGQAGLPVPPARDPGGTLSLPSSEQAHSSHSCAPACSASADRRLPPGFGAWRSGVSAPRCRR